MIGIIRPAVRGVSGDPVPGTAGLAEVACPVRRSAVKDRAKAVSEE